MRKRSIGCVAAGVALAATVTVAASCYNPNLGGIGYYCHVDDNPACPVGATCMAVGADFRCVASVGGGGGDMAGQMGLIPKSGPGYTGQHNDPMLKDVLSCPDSSLEPNDRPQDAVPAPAPMPDTATPKITKMAICPTGPRPETGLHDVDYFKVDTSSFGATTLSLMAEIFYDISYGDLDVAIFDQNGMLLSADGTSVTNGCTAASIGAGVYYVVVAGANNVDVNRYDVRIRSFSAARTCPTQSPPPSDLGM